MLAMATTSASSSRRRRRAAGDAWRRLSPVVAQIPLDFRALGSRKSQQRMPPLPKSVDSLVAELGDEEVQGDHEKLPRRGVFAAFRNVAFPDSDEDLESDYVPSEQDDGEDDMSSADEGEEDSASALFARYDRPSDVDDDDDVAVDDDRRWWRSREDKRRWRERYQAADAAFRRRFGCAIDSPALPETRRRLRREKTRRRTYTLVLGALVVAYLAQLVAVYSASSWAFSMVTWQSSTPHSSDNRSVATPDSDSSSSIEPQAAKTEDLGRSKQREIPEHVLTGLHLCATLSRRVVKSQHDVTATQHALRACEIAVKFAPHATREAVEARVLRGDLRSLLSRFDGADEDYQTALDELQDIASSSGDAMLSPRLRQHLELKVVANHWSQLYKAKKFKELRREAKAQAVVNDGQQDDAALAKALRELASDWLHVFKREKPVLEVLTRQRGWTLRRLEYEIGEDRNEEEEAETET
ncbi:hypothetical protein BBJ28_00004192 [Nothophytophthora sp. Chile5]|nr:hypothetical protein BBJ28_00004192 [Nothophytophthora sp. Chile5]